MNSDFYFERRELNVILASLEDRYPAEVEAVRRYYLDGVSPTYRSLAKEFGITEGAVRSRIKRLFEVIRKEFPDFYDPAPTYIQGSFAKAA